jgi:hypothetical protein
VIFLARGFWISRLQDTLDGPFPCLGKSDVEGYFEGPYYEWFRFNKDYTEFQGVEDAISFISDHMKTHGPYDGLVGFSQVLAPVALSLSIAFLQPLNSQRFIQSLHF